MADVTDRRTRYIVLLLHAVFLLSGTATILIGQVLPLFAVRFGLDDLQLSYFFPVQFSGSLLGTLWSRYFARRNSFVVAAVIGCAAMSIGVLLLNSDSFVVCLAGFLLNGIGIGLTLPSINLLIFELNPVRSGQALSVLNFCWGVGAIICKPFVDLTSRESSIFLTTALLALSFAAAALPMYLLGPGFVEPTASTAFAEADQVADKPGSIWSTGVAWSLAVFNFVHVGYESAVGGWLTTYAERVEGPHGLQLLTPTFLYFSFFVAGRGIAPLFFRIFTVNTVIMIDLVIILIGTVATLSADSVFLLNIGASIAGFGTASVFPATVARFGNVFGSGSTRRATPLFIAGTVGAAAVTSLIGFVSEKTGSLHAGMFVMLACVSALIILQSFLTIRTGTKTAGGLN